MSPRVPELYGHADALDALNRSVPLEQKLAAIHEALYAQIDFVDRISVAAYDRPTDLLKTFLAGAPGRNDLVRYEARLSESPSLSEILRTGRPRVVNDLNIFRDGRRVHTKILEEQGYRSSYTVPMVLDGSFWGFIFFNSRISGQLSAAALGTLDVYAHLISAVVTAEMLAVRVLAAAVKTAHDMVHYRDPETGAHIDRMARYARLIAQHLAATGTATLDDAAIERIYSSTASTFCVTSQSRITKTSTAAVIRTGCTTARSRSRRASSRSQTSSTRCPARARTSLPGRTTKPSRGCARWHGRSSTRTVSKPLLSTQAR